MCAHLVVRFLVVSTVSIGFFLSAGAALAVPVLLWEVKAPFMDPRRAGGGIEGAAASMIGGKLYVSEGCCGDNPFLSIYDTATDTWTYGGASAPDSPGLPRSEGAGGTAFGKHYSIGGRPVGGGAGTPVNEFDPAGPAWAVKDAMTTARAGLGTASVGGKIYAVGGRLGDTPGAGVALSAFEVFDPTAAAGLQWAGLPALPVALMDVEATIGLDAATSGTAAGAILVFGGRTAAPGTEVATTYLFDIALGAWSAKAAMPTARGNGMAGLISLGSPFDGKVAVFGGFAGGPNLSVTELYDPLTDTWSAGPAMAVAVSEMAVGPTWDGSGIYSVGSGPFGIAGMVVQRLVVVDVPEPGTALLLALGLLGGLAPQLRRRARI